MTDVLAAAVRALGRGALVVYPTDTLWGLGARARDRAAVARLYRAKARPAELPVSVAVSSLEEVEPLTEMTPVQRAYLRRELPGRTTVVLPPSARALRSLAPEVLGPRRVLAIRIPDHPLARELARRAGPITCTSANRHGAPDATELSAVRAALADEVAVYLDGAPAPSGSASRVIDLTGPVPDALRG